MRRLTRAFQAAPAAFPEDVNDVVEGARRWRARPALAAGLRATAFCGPIALSAVLVYVAARFVPPPRGSASLYVGWWAALSGGATAVLVIVGRLSRRLLPLEALMRLSLVFPDGAPSRFALALRSGTVATLEERLVDARRGAATRTPTEAAELLLELVALLDTHDGLTRGHSERVRAYAQSIGRELGLGRAELDQLNWAALLHDVGKLEVPAEVLGKSGRPTEREWELLRRHPAAGAELAAPLRDWLGEWFGGIEEHHERWDGAGYPDGREGAQICLAGRIVAVADVYDVITSSRSYKHAKAPHAARRELARCAGTQFDPDVVRAFLELSVRPPRFVTGPLAWLAHATVLARVPLASAVGAVSAASVVLGTGVAVTPNAAARGPLAAPSHAAAVQEAPRRATTRRAVPARAEARPPRVARTSAGAEPTHVATAAREVAAAPDGMADEGGTVTQSGTPTSVGPANNSDASAPADALDSATTPATDLSTVTEPVEPTVGTVHPTLEDTVSQIESTLPLPPVKAAPLAPRT